MNQSDENKLFLSIREGDQQAFEQVFRKYYKYLCAFAARMLGDADSAEEIVQDFFVRLWEKREQLSIDTALKSYLFRSVRNSCLNYLKHEKVKDQYARNCAEEAGKQDFDDCFMEVGLEQDIRKTIDALPPRRREIFILSREEGLKYKEIAEHLQISVKTVEAQMGQAIRFLRENLKKYKGLVFFLMTGSKGK